MNDQAINLLRRPRNCTPPGAPLLLTLAACNCLLLVGCDSSSRDRITTFRTFGSVTVNGKAQEGVVLQLMPGEDNPIAETRLRPGAVTMPDGSFEMTTYSSGDGAPSGEYRLILFWPPKDNGGFAPPGSDTSQNHHRGPPDRFHGKYFAAEKSPWKVTVSESETDLGVIEITEPASE